MSGWDLVVPVITEDDRKRVIEDVSGQLKSLSLAEMRGEREKLIARVTPLVQTSISRLSLQVTPDQAMELAREVVARVGGSGLPRTIAARGFRTLGNCSHTGWRDLGAAQGRGLVRETTHRSIAYGCVARNGNIACTSWSFRYGSLAFGGCEDPASGRIAGRRARQDHPSGGRTGTRISEHQYPFV